MTLPVAIGIVLIIGVAFAVLFEGTLLVMQRGLAQRMIERATPHRDDPDHPSLILRIASRLPALDRVVLPAQRVVMARRLWRLGYHAPQRLAAFGLIKVLGALAGILIGLLAALISPAFGLLMMACFAGLGFYIPDRVVDSRIKAFDERIGREFPEFLDLLTLCVRSGMTLEASLSRIATTKKDSPLGPDLDLVTDRLNLGESLTEAVGHLRAQGDISSALAEFLKRTDVAARLGVPLSQTLEQSAHEMRRARYEIAKTAAAKLPVKILMPMMLCLLPAILLVVLGPAVLKLIDGFSQL